MSHATGVNTRSADAAAHWCSGCGIGTHARGRCCAAFEELGYEQTDTVVVTGIGCTGKSDDYMITNALHTTHGRALAYATGIKAFNPKLERRRRIMGDGDSVTIGGNHFIHAARRNMDLTAIILNNLNFGMTGGQVSGTTPAQSFTSTTAYGNPERDFDIRALAEAAGANYVARCTPYHGWEMKENMKEALTKKGFSVVEVVSPCPTHFGRHNEMKETADMLHWLRRPGHRDRRVPPPARGEAQGPHAHRHAGLEGLAGFQHAIRARQGRGRRKAEGRLHRMTDEKKHFEVILAGTGGQGLILSGILLAEAAILEGKNVAQTQSYGIASRGGLSLAEVIIDTEEIIFQQVQTPDCILALTEEAAKKYEAWAAEGRADPLRQHPGESPGRRPNFTAMPSPRRQADLGSEGSVNILALADRGRKDGRS
ncbi:MAG: thiamine pyrophosphate-dependent enzyme [Desulfobacterales bacterium]|nr:thiamine pyrophosphate-dependent enzyme [Desulfobacterales bacterium]